MYVSSPKGAEKTGHPHTKEWIQIHIHHPAQRIDLSDIKLKPEALKFLGVNTYSTVNISHRVPH